MAYDTKIDYGEIMDILDFASDVSHGFFIDYDGDGYFVKDGKADKTICMCPSNFHFWHISVFPDATHVVWYNR